MAETYTSSNPFRRKTPTTTPSIPPEPSSNINHIAYQQAEPLADSTNVQKIDAPKKAAKKVRVQSPPPPSPSTPSIPDSSSTIGEDIYAKPPTPIPRDEDPFDSTTSDTSDDEEEDTKPLQAPLNPFSKTLETMEHPERDASAIPQTSITSPGRASMDVEAFKRLLMTGNAGLGISTPPTASPAHVHHGLGDGGSSTDTSSVSRQSIFEPIQETHTETPRTSHEISEPEDDRRGLMTAEFSSPTSARKAPPPPSSRHGKLIKVELRDELPSSSSIPLVSPQPPTPGSATSSQFFSSSPPNRSNTDLNKPLPPAPARASHESDRESIFDKESLGKTPEPPSPSTSLRRKTPPAPPITRRHSTLVSSSKITQETGRLSPKVEEDSPSIASVEFTRPRSDSAKSQAPPPPPPSRRPGSIRSPSHPNPLVSPSSVSLPPPTPPARGSSRSISGRPPSVVSMDMGFGSAGSKRISMAPPPPPPRHGRGSMDDGSRRTSMDLRRPSEESVRKVSGAEKREQVESVGGVDILADISKLQAEIDALRTQSERGAP